jgi:hypothetical protein
MKQGGTLGPKRYLVSKQKKSIYVVILGLNI